MCKNSAPSLGLTVAEATEAAGATRHACKNTAQITFRLKATRHILQAVPHGKAVGRNLLLWCFVPSLPLSLPFSAYFFAVKQPPQI